MQSSVGLFTAEDRFKAALIGWIVVVDAAWIAVAGYQFNYRSAVRVIVVTGVLLLVAELYRCYRPHENFVVMTRETAWLLAFSAPAAILSNLAVTMDRPLIDRSLAAFGPAVGFDWMFWHTVIATQPAYNLIFSILYVLVLPQIVFAMVALALMGQVERVRELVLAAMVGALIAIVISAIFPSAGALAYFHPHDSAQTVVDLQYKQTFFDLRAGNVQTFSLDSVKGLIAFPSYHATLCVLVVLSFRGVSRVFWPMAAFNLLMIASAPIEGGHFLVDVVGGSAVAIVSLAIARVWRRQLGAPAQPVPAESSAGAPLSFSERA